MLRKHLSLAMLAACTPAAAGTVTVNVGGDPAGAGNCPTSCSLRQAIAHTVAGDIIVFNPAVASPINLAHGELLVGKALTIQGPGAAKLTVSAQNLSRVLNVSSSHLVLSNVTLADGAVVGTNGTDSVAAAAAKGGCVSVASGASLTLDHVAVLHCLAQGGGGANGQMGLPGYCTPIDNPPTMYTCTSGGDGSPGGSGGPAYGGAIFADGALTLTHSSVVNGNAKGGGGGLGGYGGLADPRGGEDGLDAAPGDGAPALGGAIYATPTASLHIVNSTITRSTATGGDGASSTGVDGYGGDARGGLIGSQATVANVEFSTLTNGVVNGGGSFAGILNGKTYGSGIWTAATTQLLSSIIVGTQSGVALCDGGVSAVVGSANLSEDTSCSGFTLHATFAQTLLPLDANTTPWPGYVPVSYSPVIDAAATCKDILSQVVTTDQHDTPRPQSTKCDLGAIEWRDHIFSSGFE